jgi:hypothetical protein
MANVFTNLANDLLSSPIFGTDNSYSDIALSYANRILKKAQSASAPIKTPAEQEIVSALEKLGGGNKTTQAIIQTLISIVDGRAEVAPFNNDVFKQMQLFFFQNRKKNANEIIPEEPILNGIRQKIEEAVQKLPLKMDNDSLKRLSNCFVDNLVKVYTPSEFSSNETLPSIHSHIQELYNIFITSIKALETMGDSPKESLSIALELFETIDLSKFVNRDSKITDEDISKVVYEVLKIRAPSKKKTASIANFKIVVADDTTPPPTAPEVSPDTDVNELWQKAKSYYYYSIIRSVILTNTNLQKLLFNSPKFKAQWEKIKDYDKFITKTINSTKGIDKYPSYNSELEELKTANIMDVRDKLSEFQQNIKENRVISPEEVSQYIITGFNYGQQRITNESWAKFNGASAVVAIIKNDQFINGCANELSAAMNKDAFAFSEYFVDRSKITQLMGDFFQLKFVGETIKKGLVNPQQNFDLRKKVEELYSTFNAKPELQKLSFIVAAKKLAFGEHSNRLDKATATEIFNELKSQVSNKIKATSDMVANEKTQDVNVLKTMADQIEDPTEITRLGYKVTAGHHMQAIIFIQRLRQARIDVKSAVEYLISNIASWGKNVSTSERVDDVNEFPRNPSGIYDETKGKEATSEEWARVKSDYDDTWILPDVVALASAVLYALWLEINSGGGGYYGQ